MNFADRLDFLLKLYSINMSKLARAINVDPSLISRWRSGTRNFYANSTHIHEIASYFAGSDQYTFRKEALFLEFQRVNIPTHELISQESIEKALVFYLSSSCNNIPIQQPYRHSGLNVATEGQVGYYEMYNGVEGKRKAVIRFLQTVLESSIPQEILLFSQEEMGWLVGDAQFFSKWAALLTQVITNGHHIKIIHHVNRDPSHIVSVIEKWLPLHLTGRIEAWFLPKYSPLSFRTTLFVIKGTAALVAVVPGSRVEADVNFYYTEPVMVQLIEDMFFTILSGCDKLFDTFNNLNGTGFADHVTKMEKLPGNSLYFFSSPTLALTIPLSKEWFPGHLQSHRIIIIEFSVDSEGTNYQLDIGIEEASYFRKLISHLRTYQSFEYIILHQDMPQPFQGLQLFMKHEKGVIISSNGGQVHRPVGISFTEPTVVNAFEAYIMNKIESIPPVIRSKERNIRLIEERIKRHKGE